MRKFFEKIRHGIIATTITTLILVGSFSALFLFSPPFQRIVVRLVLRKFGFPLAIDYSKAEISPGKVMILELWAVYNKGNYIEISADTLSFEYDLGDTIKLTHLNIARPRVVVKTSETARRKGEKIGIPMISLKDFKIFEGFVDIDGQKIENLTCNGDILVDGGNISFKFGNISALITKRGRITYANPEGVLSGNLISLSSDVRLVRTNAHIDIKKLNIDNQTFVRVTLSGDSVDITEIDTLIDLQAFEGNGKLFFDIQRPETNIVFGRVELTGELFGFQFSGAKTDFRFDGSQVEIKRLSGAILGADVVADVKFKIDREPISYWGSAVVKNLQLSQLVEDVEANLSGNCNFSGSGTEPWKDLNLTLECDLGNGDFLGVKFDTALVHLNLSPSEIIVDTCSWVVSHQNKLAVAGNIDYDDNINFNYILTIENLHELLKIFGISLENLSGKGKIRGAIRGNLGKPSASFALEQGEVKYGEWTARNIIAGGNFSDLKTLDGNIVTGFSLFRDGEIAADSVEAQLSLSNKRAFLHPMSVKGKDFSFFALGTIDFERRAAEVSDMSFLWKGSSIELLRPLFVLWGDTITILPTSLGIAGGEIYLDTSFVHNMDTIYFNIFGTRMDISVINNIVELPFKIGGNARFELKGKFIASAQGIYSDGKVEVDKLLADTISIGGVFSLFHTQGDTLILDKFFLIQGPDSFKCSGWSTIDTVPAFSLHIEATENTPGVISSFFPDIDPTKGRYSLSLYANSSAKGVSLSGFLRLRDGKILVPDIDKPIDLSYAKIRFADSIVAVDTFLCKMSAQSPKSRSLLNRLWRAVFGERQYSGDISASGNVVVTKNLKFRPDVKVSINKLPISSSTKGFFFVINGAGNLSGYPPTFSAEISVEEGDIVSFRGGASSETQIPIELNIFVATADVVGIYTGDIRANINGELFISASGNNISVLGDLNIKDGEYFGYGTRFRIEKGVMAFQSAQKIDPDLHITASTFVGNEKITVEITGTLSAPQIAMLSSNPDYTQQDILMILSGIGGEKNDLTANLEDRARNLLASYLQKEVEKAAQKTIGVDELTITATDSAGNIWQGDELKLTIGKRISGKFFLRYSQTISDDPKQQIELEYRLSNRSTISMAQDENGYYRAKLKFRWEY